MRPIPHTDLTVHPLCLGGNVFGWTADRERSFTVLDRYAEAGGNFIDTADVYMAGPNGSSGGESETIIGSWMAERGNRDRMVIATKVGKAPGSEGLAASNIAAAAEASLERLGTDRIDLYYAHADDGKTPLEETLGAFDALVKAGKVRHIAASNYSAERLGEALETSDREGLARYVALQPHYNLMERGYETDGLEAICDEQGLACMPYFSLAMGFLSGKYRPGAAGEVESQRAEGAAAYLDARGERVLEVLDDMSASRHTPVSALALGWLAEQPTVVAPIASARTVDQLEELLRVADLKLSPGELDRLDEASAA